MNTWQWKTSRPLVYFESFLIFAPGWNCSWKLKCTLYWATFAPILRALQVNGQGMPFRISLASLPSGFHVLRHPGFSWPWGVCEFEVLWGSRCCWQVSPLLHSPSPRDIDTHKVFHCLTVWVWLTLVPKVFLLGGLGLPPPLCHQEEGEVVEAWAWYLTPYKDTLGFPDFRDHCPVAPLCVHWGIIMTIWLSHPSPNNYLWFFKV